MSVRNDNQFSKCWVDSIDSASSRQFRFHLRSADRRVVASGCGSPALTDNSSPLQSSSIGGRKVVERTCSWSFGTLASSDPLRHTWKVDWNDFSQFSWLLTSGTAERLRNEVKGYVTDLARSSGRCRPLLNGSILTLLNFSKVWK